MSNANFEIKYIETRWHNKETLLELSESQYSLPLDQESKDSYETFTTIYPNVEDLRRSQIAIAYTDRRFSTPPVIELSDGTTIQLKKVVNPDTHKVWWVEPGTWNPKSKEWRNNTHRTAGMIRFRIGKQILVLQITLNDASKDELDKYLIDFKSDMWELILDENSYVQGDAKQGIVGSVDETTLKCIDSILNAARQVLKQPKSELREIQTLKPRNSVKPVPRTFMEIVTKGNTRVLTSRGAKPNYDVPENRYILYALIATQRIVSQLHRVSQSKTERLANNLQKLDHRLDSLKSYKTVNRELVVRDYLKAKSDQDVNHINAQLVRTLADINTRKSHYGKVIYLKLENENNWGGHFCKVKFDLNAEWHPYPGYRYSSVNLGNIYDELFEKYTEYKLVAEVSLNSFGDGVSLELIHISHIEIVGEPRWLKYRKDKLKAMEDAAISLKNSEWKKPLTAQELDEQNKERNSIENRKEFFTQQLNNVSHIRRFLAPKEKQLRDLIKQLDSLQIKPKNTFPNSMTFVQNPSYQAVHAGYKKLREQVGLTDEDILMSLEKIDSIGLVNIPLLYERWCLLQIIKTLIHSFRFIAEDGWKRKLLRTLEVKGTGETIIFSNLDSKRELSLCYEPRLENGKTPDFVIDASFEAKNGTLSKKRIVLDAKFYSEGFMCKRGGLRDVVRELAYTKDYSEGEQNTVFVLHPTQNALKEVGGPVSPQDWGEVSYLGELRLFEWDKRMHPHQYGAVCLNPLISHQHGDELQRLIGMILQYETGKPVFNDDVENYNMCVACGSSSLRTVPLGTFEKNKKKVWYQCNECDLFAVYNHCHNCNHRLIKNGEHWTYHATMPMQPINIKCPECESPV